MDKTSREYAEKEAARITFEKASTISSWAGKQTFNMTSYNEAALTGYLTAVEETNAKGRYFQSSDSYIEHEEVVKVEWYNTGYAFRKKDGKLTNIPKNAKITVIGNIYENKNLLD